MISSNCEIPTLRTHEPKQFFAVYKKRTKRGKNVGISKFAKKDKTRAKAIRSVLTPSPTASNIRGCSTYVPRCIGPDFCTILSQSQTPITGQSIFERCGCLSSAESSRTRCTDEIGVRIPNGQSRGKTFGRFKSQKQSTFDDRSVFKQESQKETMHIAAVAVAAETYTAKSWRVLQTPQFPTCVTKPPADSASSRDGYVFMR